MGSSGAAPLTRKCLESDKVIHKSESDPKQVQYKEIEKMNHNACHLLIAKGYNSNMLKVQLKKEKKTKAGTVANPKSDVQWVADAKSYAMKFIQTGASHSCTDLNFKAPAELTTCRGKRAVMQKEKAACQNAEKIEKEALATILEKEGADTNRKLTGSQLHTLLLFYGIERKNHGKTVGESRAKYKKLKEENTPPKKYKKWTESNKAKLTRLTREDVKIEETELARQREKAVRVDTQRLIAMTKLRGADELIKIIRANSPSANKSASESESESTKSASEIKSTSEILLLSQLLDKTQSSEILLSQPL